MVQAHQCLIPFAPINTTLCSPSTLRCRRVDQWPYSLGGITKTYPLGLGQLEEMWAKQLQSRVW